MRIRLITDGDVGGAIATADPATGIDVLLGMGGAPEGVLAAAALRCFGGDMQGMLQFRNDEERVRADAHGHRGPDHVFAINELASGDVMFAATGVTDGFLLRGVRFTERRRRDQLDRHALALGHRALHVDAPPLRGAPDLRPRRQAPLGRAEAGLLTLGPPFGPAGLLGCAPIQKGA